MSSHWDISHHLVTNPLLLHRLLAFSCLLWHSLARVPSPPVHHDGVKDSYQGREFHFLPLFMVLKDKLDQASLCMGADTCSGLCQDPSGHTRPHKASISLQRHEDTPYPRCESSLGFRMPKAAASTPQSFDFKPKAEADDWVEAKDRVRFCRCLCRSHLELHRHSPRQTGITSNLASTTPSLVDRVYRVNLGPSYSFGASSLRSFK